MLKQKILKNRCEILNPPPFGLIIFGASGHLANNKFFPSLFGLFKKSIIKNNFYIIGVGRTDYKDNSFRKMVEKSIKTKYGNIQNKILSNFCMHFYYINGQYEADKTYLVIKDRIINFNKKYKTEGNIIYNLATPPFLFETIISKLIKNNLIKRNKGFKYFERLMIEKPFGYDLESAKNLNKIILNNIDDNQVFRIDHYLGKSTVQNILIFRFANTIFQNLWNKENIDSIHILFKETHGVEERLEYFDKTGLLRDVFQNHILQLIALIAMEKPKSFQSNDVQNEKLKIFKSIKPLSHENIKKQIIFGQYKGYREYNKNYSKSCTETFFITRLFIDNHKWAGVPFYILAGKKLDCEESSIKVIFKRKKDCLLCDEINLQNKNLIQFKIKPQQGVSINFLGKVPGARLCTKPFTMDFNYKDLFGNDIIVDYESVILECLYGDHTIFWDKKSVEYSWRIVEPLLNKLKKCSIEEKNNMLKIYQPGSSGPIKLDDFIENIGE